jgi:PAS domain S-box-containing protein
MIPQASDVATRLARARLALERAPVRVTVTFCLANLVWIFVSNALIDFFALPYASYTVRAVVFLLGAGAALWIFHRRLAADVIAAQALVAAAENSYRVLFDTHPAPMLLFDKRDLCVVRANGAALGLYAYGADELVGMSLLDLLAPRSRKPVEQAEAAQRTARLDGVQRHINGDGRLLDVRVQSQDFSLGSGSMGVLLVQDLRSDLDAGTPLAMSLQQLELAQQVAMMGHWEFDLHSGQLDWSPEIFSLLGLDPLITEPTRTNYLDHVSPADREAVELAYQRAVDEGQCTHEYSVICGEGRIRYLFERLQVISDAQGVRRTLFGAFMDITELKEAQGNLAEQKRRYEKMVQSLPDGVLIVRDGVIQFANDAALRLLGSEPQRSLQGGDFAVSLHPEHRSRELDRLDAIQRGLILEPSPRKIRLLRGDGIPFEAEITEIPLENGSRRDIQLMIRDISQAQQMRSDLEQANIRLQQLSQRLIEVQEVERRQLALDLHDDLGQQLTALKLHLQRLERRLQGGDEQVSAMAQELIEQVVEALSKVRSLSLALHPLQLETLGLEAAMRWHLQHFLAASGTNWELQVEGDLGELPPSRAVAVFRVMQEAVSNVARHADATTVRIAINGLARELRMEILDDGRGFDVPEAASGARSLGLTSMQERVASQGGDLTISSLPGIGTRITAVLPAS